MDGFGDHPTGPLSDDCPADSGISYFFVQGCADYEHDGFADDIDACDTTDGRSVYDRYGCPDFDEDGAKVLSNVYFFLSNVYCENIIQCS